MDHGNRLGGRDIVATVKEGGEFYAREVFQDLLSGFCLGESSAHTFVLRNTYCETLQPR